VFVGLGLYVCGRGENVCIAHTPDEPAPTGCQRRIITPADRVTIEDGMAQITWAETDGAPTVEDLRDGDIFESDIGIFWRTHKGRFYSVLDNSNGMMSEHWLHQPGGIKRILGKAKDIRIVEGDDDEN
jgi:hypothetical protein